MIIVSGQPPVVEEVELPPRVETGPETHALTWEYHAPGGGRVWRLTDLTSPVVKLRGALGTGKVDNEGWWDEPASLDGATWQGVRLGRGQLFIPVLVRGADTADFAAQHDAFIRTLSRKDPAVVRIIRPDATWRQATVRYQAGADTPIDLDPMKARLHRYGITWSRESPFWAGQPVVKKFKAATPGAFFPGPPFPIGDVLSFASAEITNPGHEPVRGVWRIHGPFTGFTVGLGSSLVSMTLTRSAGQWVEVDMRHGKLTMLDNAGADVWDAATAAKFTSIPAGTSPLVINVTGAGVGTEVWVTIEPLYETGW